MAKLILSYKNSCLFGTDATRMGFILVFNLDAAGKFCRHKEVFTARGPLTRTRAIVRACKWPDMFLGDKSCTLVIMRGPGMPFSTPSSVRSYGVDHRESPDSGASNRRSYGP